MSDKTSPNQTSKVLPGLLRYWQQDLLASLVVFLVALPLCMGIALASGAPVSAGLITGIIGGLMVGALAGAPLQVSGPAAGLTVICGELIREYGMPGLGIAVMIGGLIQLMAGISRLGQWFRAVSPAVIHGMLSGIGILILSSQLHVLVDDRPRENAVRNLLALPQSLTRLVQFSPWEAEDIRKERITALSTVNSCFDRQRMLQASLERLLTRIEQQPVGSSETQLDLSQFAISQNGLQQDLIRAADHLRTTALLDKLTHDTSTTTDPVSGCLDATAAAVLALEARTDTLPEPAIKQIRSTQLAAVTATRNLLNGLKRNDWAGKVGLLAVITIFCWQWLARGRLKLIPAPLLAIIIATAVAHFFSMPVLYVNVPGNLLSGITWPSMASLRELPFREVFLSGFVLAVIASAETLLCATAVDQMQNGPRTRYNKELIAQGLGNTLCGILGVLPMTGVIVRSAANVQAGGKTRLSAILHGIWLLLFTLALTPLLRMIPTAALAGILVYTGFRLIDFKGLRHLWKTNRGDAFIFLITVLLIIVEDLLIGVVTGIVLSAARLLFQFSRLDVIESSSSESVPGSEKTMLSLSGAATFLRLPKLASRLEKVPAGAELHVDLSQLDYIDHACLELIINWAKQHSATGGRLVMDWDSLHARFQQSGK